MLKTIARQIPQIDRLVKSRDDLVRCVEDLVRRQHHQRELYLDLMIKTLTNIVYADPSIHPDIKGFDLRHRNVGADWPHTAHTMVGIERLTNLKELTQRAIDEGVPGHLIETGVWRGGCCILMRAVLKANDIADRTIFVADSFAGLPPPNPDRDPADAGDNLHTYEELSIPIEQVRANFASYGLLDEQVVFLSGLFQDTLPALTAGPFALIRLDGDMYESTIVALQSLYPKLSPGGFVIVDDYALRGCKAAVDDFRKAQAIIAEIHTIDWTGVWWQKPPSKV